MSRLTTGECQCRLWHGLIPAVPVPFTAGGELDSAAQARYVAWMAKQPIAGVAVWVHTGRGLHLSREQRSQVLRSWVAGLDAKKVVVAGVGGRPEQAADFSAYIASALEMARDALDAGAHAFLVHPPRLFHHVADNRQLLLTYHREIASTGVPQFLFYLYEAAGGFSYTAEHLRSLLALPEVAGIKLATLDSVMTFQGFANLIAKEFPQKLILTGEDRFLGYSLMCGATAALIGMGAACTSLQANMMRAYYDGRAAEFLELSRAVDRLSQVTFIPPMEGYIRRMLWALVHQGVIGRESAHDPWGPELTESEFTELGNCLRELERV
ncbi:MAG TPA: dihydrodipicolinate synthase family protein [Terriglobia bacterium]|nr:dihydrodipicolinate synthase family protein [Terriglobia bacterium]